MAKESTKIKLTGVYKASGEVGFKPHDAGMYLFEITKFDPKWVSKKGKPGLFFELTSRKGPDQEDERDASGWTYRHYIMIPQQGEPAPKPFVVNQQKNFSAAFAFEVDKNDNVDFSDAEGRQAWGDVSHRLDDNGKPQEQVREWFNTEDVQEED
jgi:hypothetical protein